jgi:Xaa-Pro aminopeptidase
VTAALDAVRAWLAQQGADVAIVTKPASVGYLTGVFVHPHERLLALSISRDRAVLVLPALDAARAEAAVVPGVELRGYRDGEDSAALVPLGRRPAVEKAHITLALAERTDALDALDVAPELRRLRMIKSPDEIAALDEAVAITQRVIDAAFREARPGMSELELAGFVLLQIAAAGADPSFDPLVQSGPNSAYPHGHPSSRTLEAGDLLLLDIGAARRHYKGDLTRTRVLGEPDSRQRELIDLVQRAHDRALEVARPGITGAEVDAAVRRVIEEAGEGSRFIHRTGHGLGLEAHEDPNFASDDATVLEPGMVITVEPGVYIPGWGGIRIEDDLLVEPSGARWLGADATT